MVKVVKVFFEKKLKGWLCYVFFFLGGGFVVVLYKLQQISKNGNNIGHTKEV